MKVNTPFSSMESALLNSLVHTDINQILNFCSFEDEDLETEHTLSHSDSDITNVSVEDRSNQRTPEDSTSGNDDSSSEGSEHSDNLEDCELQAPPLQIPSTSCRLVPHSYERALANRVKLEKLESDGEMSADRFSAVFLHDIMMLPGSLASVISKHRSDTYNIVKRMTSAVISGFRTHIHPETKQPCMVQSPCPADFVQGMVMIGLQDREVKRINRHYRNEHRTIRINVEIEVLRKDTMTCDYLGLPKWTSERCRLWAHSWIWSDLETCGSGYDDRLTPNWSLEDYLEGKYDEYLETGESRERGDFTI